MTRISATPLCAIILAVTAADAAELLPLNTAVSTAVDHYIDANLQSAGVQPAPSADDANLLRRTMLDLVGRIATVSEVRAYLQADDLEKRVELVDRLIASPAFAGHHANEFDALLMNGADGSLREYLVSAFEEGISWDAMFREMLTADEQSSRSAANQYVKGRVKDLDQLANDVSVMFFGVNVSCAKCHDHPLVPEWTQAHFYGMKSFFSRTFENGGFLGERDYGVVKYKTTDGDEKLAELVFLSGTVVDEPEATEPSDQEKKDEKQRLEQLKKDKQPVPPPTFSRRVQLVDVALRPEESGYFARSIVNRTWHRLFGYGLVMPIDQMHPENPASHPELLEWLARDLVEHQFDLRRLIRGLTLSRAYARSSRWESGDPPPPDLFAVARVRPLAPQQYATSLRLASANPDRFSGEVSADELAQKIDAVENGARGFAGLIEQPGQEFQVSITEALLFNNSQRIIDDFLRDSADSLVGKLKTLQDPEEVVETAAWNVLGRAPDEDERELLARFLATRQDNQLAARQQLVWALLTSSELRFNY